MTDEENERLLGVTDHLTPLQVTRLSVDLLRRLIASVGNTGQRPTAAEIDACAVAVGRLPWGYQPWHVKVFDKARAALLGIERLPLVALLTAQHVEAVASQLAGVGIARAATGGNALLDEQWRAVRAALVALADDPTASLVADIEALEDALGLTLLSNEHRALLATMSAARSWSVNHATDAADKLEALSPSAG